MPLCHVRPQTLVVLLRRDLDVRHPLARTRLFHDMKHRRTRHFAAARRATESKCRPPRAPCQQSPLPATCRDSLAVTVAGRS
eukprot:7620722-Alexandrium_andersonii.AAC.1